MNDISTLYLELFDLIEKEFEPEDYAVIGEAGSVISALEAGQMAKGLTHANRRMIYLGTPLGTIIVGENSPLNPQCIQLKATPEFMALFPNPMEDYMQLSDWFQIFGDESHGFNIGLRLKEAYAVMMKRFVTNNVNGTPLSVVS